MRIAGLFCAARGISLDETDLDANKPALQKIDAFSKGKHDRYVGGRFERLLETDNDVCWQFTTRDRSKIFLVYFQILNGVNQPFRPVKLRHLEPDQHYACDRLKSNVQGDNLMSSGLPIKLKELKFDRHTKRDFMSELYVLERV